MTHEEICTYEVSKLAKEKGFQLDCIGYYDFVGEFHFNYESAISNKERTFCHNKYNNIWHRDLTDAPTQSLLQRWLREEKKISVEVSWFDVGNKYFWVAKDMNNHDVFKPKTTKCMTFYDTWEQALEHGLKYALENLV